MSVYCVFLVFSMIISVGGDRNETGSKTLTNNVETGSGQNKSSGITGSDQYIHSVLGTTITIKPGRHVCTTEKVRSKPVKVTQLYKKPVYVTHPRDCSDFNNCPQFDVKYEDTNRTVFLLQKSSSFRHSCCPGWTKGTKREKGCMAPICTNGCGDFGICVKPEVCDCPRGYNGEFCDRDVDECQTEHHDCQQICKNTAGSYVCACQKGFSLAEDGKTCNYCYKCQKEYTDLVLSVENIQKSLSGGVIMQAEQVQSFTTQQSTIIAKMESLEHEIRNLTEENKRLETDLMNINDNFKTANQEIERLQNITRTTEAPPTTSTTTQSTTSTTSSTITIPMTTTTTTTTSAFQDQGLEFSLEDMLYSLSNQIGMLEEKLELCNCHARRRP